MRRSNTANVQRSSKRHLFGCPLLVSLTALVFFAASGHAQETVTAEVLRLEGHTGPLFGAVITTNNDLVVSAGADGTVRTWPIKDWKSDGSHAVLRHPTRARVKAVIGLDLSPDEKWIASSGFDGRIGIWQLSKGVARLATELTSLTNLATPVRFSRDSKLLAAVQRDPGRICIWRIAREQFNQSVMLEAPGCSAWSLGFAPESKKIAVGLVRPGAPKAGAVWLWDLSQSPPTKRVLLEGVGLPRSVTFSPDGRQLAFGEANEIRLVDAESGKETGVLTGHSAGKHIVAIAFSPDGTKLLSGGYDNTIRHWDVQGKEQLGIFAGKFQGVEDLRFAGADQMAVAATKDGFVRVLKLAALKKPTSTAASDSPNQKPAVERLKELKSLHEQGLISKEDYDKKVKEILEAL